jgi:zinc transporter
MSFVAISAVVLDGKGGARVATETERETGRSADGLIWLHLDYADTSVREWMRNHSGLDEVTTAALLSSDPRPRAMPFGDGLLVVLRGVNVNDGANPEDMVSVRIWLEERRAFTLRHRRLLAVQDVLTELDAGKGPEDAGDLLHDVVARLLDRIGTVVDDVEDTSDALEEQLLTIENRALRTRLADLRRRAIALRRHIAPQRETLTRLPNERVDWMGEVARAQLRESADRVTRFLETLDAARERAAVTNEELSQRMAEQMNHTMYTLSVVAAIFLPLSLLTGLLGINVGGIPGVDWPWAFALVTLILVVLGVAEWLWFKRRRLF